MVRFRSRLERLERELRRSEKRKRGQWEIDVRTRLADHPDPPYVQLFGSDSGAAAELGGTLNNRWIELAKERGGEEPPVDFFPSRDERTRWCMWMMNSDETL